MTDVEFKRQFRRRRPCENHNAYMAEFCEAWAAITEDPEERDLFLGVARMYMPTNKKGRLTA